MLRTVLLSAGVAMTTMATFVFLILFFMSLTSVDDCWS